MKIFNIITLFGFLFDLILSYVPDIENAELINELDIKCINGYKTFKLSKQSNKKYLLRIFAHYTFGDIYEGNNRLSYCNASSGQYYYSLTGKEDIYFAGYSSEGSCVSFLFLDTPYINIKEGEEFSYPALDSYSSKVIFMINDTLFKNISLYISIPGSDGTITSYFNNKEYSSGICNNCNLNYASKNNDTKVEIEINKYNVLTKIKYYKLRDNYEVIKEVDIKCLNGEEVYKLYNYKNKKYLIKIEALSTFGDIYEGSNKLTYFDFYSGKYFYSLKGNEIIYYSGYSTKNSCVSFLFLDDPYISIKEGEVFYYPVLDDNSSKVKFTINNTYFKNISLYVNIPGNNGSIISYFNNKEYSSGICSNCNLNYVSKDKETKVEIKIKINKYNVLTKIKYFVIELSEEEKKEEKKKEDGKNEDEKKGEEKKGEEKKEQEKNGGIIFMYIIIGFICFLLLFCIVCLNYKNCIELYENKKIDNFLQEYFPLLENNYTLIETTCFYCLKSKGKEDMNLFKLYDNIDLSEQKESFITENDVNKNDTSKT